MLTQAVLRIVPNVLCEALEEMILKSIDGRRVEGTVERFRGYYGQAKGVLANCFLGEKHNSRGTNEKCLLRLK